jgi:hypothetical protein
MSPAEILSHVTGMLRELGLLGYVQAFLIIGIAVGMLRKLFDRG